MTKRRRERPPHFKLEPEGHVVGSFRMALVRTPCCGRLMRVRVVKTDKKWSIQRFQMCPKRCFLWRADAKITSHGFIKRITLELAI